MARRHGQQIVRLITETLWQDYYPDFLALRDDDNGSMVAQHLIMIQIIRSMLRGTEILPDSDTEKRIKADIFESVRIYRFRTREMLQTHEDALRRTLQDFIDNVVINLETMR